jgi:hypothetical protein
MTRDSPGSKLVYNARRVLGARSRSVYDVLCT